MICLRCGHCCKNCMVAIVNNPDIGIKEDNLIVHLGNGKPCPHLLGNKPGEYSCAIHNKEWYSETPCARHGQIETSNTNCRLGEYILKLKKSEKQENKNEKKV